MQRDSEWHDVGQKLVLFKTGFFWAKGIQPDINVSQSGNEPNGIQYFYDQNFDENQRVKLF